MSLASRHVENKHLKMHLHTLQPRACCFSKDYNNSPKNIKTLMHSFDKLQIGAVQQATPNLVLQNSLLFGVTTFKIKLFPYKSSKKYNYVNAVHAFIGLFR